MAKKYPYAIIMTGFGMRPGVNGFLNSLDYYGNEVDFYLIGGKGEIEYAEEVSGHSDLSFNFNFVNIADFEARHTLPVKESMGWKARFYTFKLAEEIADDYDAIMIVDADMLCLNNIMKYFKMAKDTGFLILPNNSVGASVARIKELGIELMKGCSSPPFHNMPLFINPKKWKDLLHKVFEWGKKEPYGSMVTLSRTIFRENLLDYVFELPNYNWILTHFHLSMVKKIIEENKMYFLIFGEKMSMVHRRWWITSVCQQHIEGIKGLENEKIGKNNIRLFWEAYRFFNTQCKIKLDYDFKWYK